MKIAKIMNNQTDNFSLLLVCTERPGYYEDLKKNKAIFYDEADFGYVQKKREELKFYCKPVESNLAINKPSQGQSADQSNDQSISRSVSSSLKCTDYLRFCEGRNIYVDFRKLTTIPEPMRYRTDVLDDGDVGGWNCQLDRTLLNAQSAHRSPLQSWYEELEHFKVIEDSSSSSDSPFGHSSNSPSSSGSSPSHSSDSSPNHPSNSPPKNLWNPMHKKCDVVLNETTYIMKLDALSNLYHHFCDFVNLYVSLHLVNDDFSLDKQLLIWDTYPYRSNFGAAWKAFTNRPLLNLDQFRGKTVCFEHVIFPLLPRMVYGLYYNMPLIQGCKRSGLFHAFNRHLLNGLGILQDYSELFKPLRCEQAKVGGQKEPKAKEPKITEQNHQETKESNEESKRNGDQNQKPLPIRITFLSRTTAYRKVLNEHELIAEIDRRCDNCQVTKVDFNHRMSFEEQLKITASTDVFIGMHGAGLTHLLFLPDWAVLFELFNCDDDCYRDLARLRGVHYVTWMKRNKLKYIRNEEHTKRPTSYLKFTDYQFDTEEFWRRLQVALKYVRKKKATYLKRFGCLAGDLRFKDLKRSEDLKKSDDLKRSDDLKMSEDLKKSDEMNSENRKEYDNLNKPNESVNNSNDLPKTEL